MRIIEFKSDTPNYHKEADDIKCNTIRKIDLTDERFLSKPRFIRIIHKQNLNEFCVKELTDITDWNGLRIYSWHPDDED